MMKSSDFNIIFVFIIMFSFYSFMSWWLVEYDVQYTPLEAVGVGRGADMSLTGFHPLWDKILSQNQQAVADQGCHLEGSSPYKGTAYRGVHCNWEKKHSVFGSF
jgi:hypothetical protein